MHVSDERTQIAREPSTATSRSRQWSQTLFSMRSLIRRCRASSSPLAAHLASTDRGSTFVDRRGPLPDDMQAWLATPPLAAQIQRHGSRILENTSFSVNVYTILQHLRYLYLVCVVAPKVPAPFSSVQPNEWPNFWNCAVALSRWTLFCGEALEAGWRGTGMEPPWNKFPTELRSDSGFWTSSIRWSGINGSEMRFVRL